MGNGLGSPPVNRASSVKPSGKQPFGLSQDTNTSKPQSTVTQPKSFQSQTQDIGKTKHTSFMPNKFFSSQSGQSGSKLVHNPSTIPSLNQRDRVSFGIKQKVSPSATSTSSSSSSQSTSPRIVMHIKNGKVYTTENSQEDKSEMQSKVKKGLVPYMEDSESDSDSPATLSSLSTKSSPNRASAEKVSPVSNNNQLKQDNIEISERPTKAGSPVKSSSESSTVYVNLFSKKDTSSGANNKCNGPILDSKLSATTNVPGAYGPLDKESRSKFGNNHIIANRRRASFDSSEISTNRDGAMKKQSVLSPLTCVTSSLKEGKSNMWCIPKSESPFSPSAMSTASESSVKSPTSWLVQNRRDSMTVTCNDSDVVPLKTKLIEKERRRSLPVENTESTDLNFTKHSSKYVLKNSESPAKNDLDSSVPELIDPEKANGVKEKDYRERVKIKKDENNEYKIVSPPSKEQIKSERHSLVNGLTQNEYRIKSPKTPKRENGLKIKIKKPATPPSSGPENGIKIKFKNPNGLSVENGIKMKIKKPVSSSSELDSSFDTNCFHEHKSSHKKKLKKKHKDKERILENGDQDSDVDYVKKKKKKKKKHKRSDEEPLLASSEMDSSFEYSKRNGHKSGNGHRKKHKKHSSGERNRSQDSEAEIVKKKYRENEDEVVKKKHRESEDEVMKKKHRDSEDEIIKKKHRERESEDEGLKKKKQREYECVENTKENIKTENPKKSGT